MCMIGSIKREPSISTEREALVTPKLRRTLSNALSHLMIEGTGAEASSDSTPT